MKTGHFRKIEKLLETTMKESHTIVDKWPMRLKLRPDQAGAKEEFNLRLGSAHLGCERYVEWKRAG
jgi:hypothetical protein